MLPIKYSFIVLTTLIINSGNCQAQIDTIKNNVLVQGLGLERKLTDQIYEIILNLDELVSDYNHYIQTKDSTGRLERKLLYRTFQIEFLLEEYTLTVQKYDNNRNDFERYRLLSLCTDEVIHYASAKKLLEIYRDFVSAFYLKLDISHADELKSKFDSVRLLLVELIQEKK